LSTCTILSSSFPSAPALYTSALSLHDALPIFTRSELTALITEAIRKDKEAGADPAAPAAGAAPQTEATTVTLTRSDLEEVLKPRSEEHTSELQSRENLVCRLLLEKKKKQHNTV